MTTSNFTFISDTRHALAMHAIKAEKYAHSDPESTAVQLRIFAEKFVDAIYCDLSIPLDRNLDLFGKMTLPDFINATESCVVDKLHLLRTKGNKAAHGKGASVDDALFLVKEAYFLSAWLFVAHDNGEVEQLLDYIKPTPSIDTHAQTHQLEQELMQSSEDLVAAKQELDTLLIENNTLVEKLAQANESVQTPSFNSETSIGRLLEKGRALFNRIDFEMAETYRRTTMSDVFSEYSLNEGQAGLVEELNNFLNLPNNKSNVFLLRGYAGTGKTFITKGLTEYFQAIRRNYILAAPTGKAAKVIANKTKSAAFTIHKTIYSFKDIGDYRVEGVDGSQTYKFYSKLAVNENSVDTVYIVDEASMISDIYNEAEFFRFGSGHLLKDFLTYINLDHNDHSKKVIFIGDDAQLPPVGMNQSPALDRRYLSENYNLNVSEFELTEVVRQKADSGIMDNAKILRDGLQRKVFNKLDFLLSKSDVTHVEYGDLISRYMESCNHKINGNSIVIAHSNADVSDYNRAIRNVFFNGNEELAPGDKVMAVTNSDAHGFFISNGDFGQVKQLNSEREVRNVPLNKQVDGQKSEGPQPVSLYFRNVTLAFRDFEGVVKVFEARVIENLLYSKEPNLSSDESKALYVDFCIRHPKLKPNTKEWTDTLRSDPYFNALRLKFGYAITCHKAQGSEWDHVFVKCKTHQNQLTADYFRWLYTAITRTSKKLYVLDEPHLNLSSNIKVVGLPVTNYKTTEDTPVSQPATPTVEISVEPSKEPPVIQAVSQPVVDETFGTSYSPFLANLLSQIKGIVEPHGLAVVNIDHSNYQEAYFFDMSGETVRINIFYNGKEKVSNLLAHNPSGSSAFIISLLEPLKGRVVTPAVNMAEQEFVFDEPFLKELHEELVGKFAPHNIVISNLVQNNYCQRYSFNKEGNTAVFDMYYNKKQQFNKTVPQPNLGTCRELLIEISELISEGVK